MAAGIQYYGTGRRKTSTARVFLRPGNGGLIINRKPIEQAFPTEALRTQIKQPLLVTETTWPASRGKTSIEPGFETNKAGQARQLARAFELFADNRRELRIRGAFWVSWVTGYSSDTLPFDYSGLLRMGEEKTFAQPSLDAYRDVIAALSASR